MRPTIITMTRLSLPCFPTARRLRQLAESLGACDITLSGEEMAQLNQVSAWE